MSDFIEGAERIPDDDKVDDKKHAEMLRGIIEQWDFREHAKGSNVSYAFKVASWVAGHFEYLTQGWSDEIDGENLPTAIAELIMLDWLPKGELHVIYPSGSNISLERKVDQQTIHSPTRLDQIIADMINKGMTYKDILVSVNHVIEDDPTLASEHVTDAVTKESIIINWHSPDMVQSGLILEIDPSHINIVPYGEPSVVKKLLPLTKHDEDSTELAKLTTELAVLAAGHCPPRTLGYFTNKREIDSFAKSLTN